MNDLISRSALLEKTIGVVVYDEGGWDCNVRAVPDHVVENAPTIEAEPVRHGRWVYAKTYYDLDECNCSLCGQLMTTEIGKRMNYCPNCGAKMDGDKHDTEE